ISCPGWCGPATAGPASIPSRAARRVSPPRRATASIRASPAASPPTTPASRCARSPPNVAIVLVPPRGAFKGRDGAHELRVICIGAGDRAMPLTERPTAVTKRASLPAACGGPRRSARRTIGEGPSGGTEGEGWGGEKRPPADEAGLEVGRAIATIAEGLEDRAQVGQEEDGGGRHAAQRLLQTQEGRLP